MQRLNISEAVENSANVVYNSLITASVYENKSGSLKVLATPSMIMLMEKAACLCMAEFLENDETTVGTEISVKHISATPVSIKVSAEAEITEVNGREISFKIDAYDEAGPIGTGTHKRFLVFGEKFMFKTNSKLNSDH